MVRKQGLQQQDFHGAAPLCIWPDLRRVQCDARGEASRTIQTAGPDSCTSSTPPTTACTRATLTGLSSLALHRLPTSRSIVVARGRGRGLTALSLCESPTGPTGSASKRASARHRGQTRRRSAERRPSPRTRRTLHALEATCRRSSSASSAIVRARSPLPNGALAGESPSAAAAGTRVASRPQINTAGGTSGIDTSHM